MNAGPGVQGPLQGTGQRRDLLVFAAILLLARVVLLLGALDPSQERVMQALDPAELSWSGGPVRPLYDSEELFTATAAQSFRLGLGLPLEAGRYYAHSSGSLMITLLAVPIYALLGPSYLAFKIIPLVVTLLGGICWFLVVRLWWGRRAAWLFGLLYLAAPSMFVRTALIAKGDHAEAMAIVGAVLLLASRAALAADPAQARRWAGACGGLTGLGAFATYATLPVLAGAAIVALACTRLHPWRTWLAFGAGLAVGLLPWVAVLVTSSGGSLQIYGRPVTETGTVSEALRRLGLLLSHGFLATYDLPGGSWVRTAAGHLWGLAVMAGWVVLATHHRRASAMVALGATATHLAAFCLRAPDASSRYLMPAYPLLIAAVAALGLRGLPERTAALANARPSLRGWGLAVIACLSATGIAAQAWAVADSRFPLLRGPLRGTDWRLFGEVSGKYLGSDRIAALPLDLRPYFYVHLGKRAYALAPREGWRQIAATAGDFAPFVWEGIGIGWTEDRGRGMEAGAYAALLEPPERAAFVQGLTRYGEILYAPLAKAVGISGLLGYLQQFPEDSREALRRSMARTLATLATQGHAVAPPDRSAPSPVPGARGTGAVHAGDERLRQLLCEDAMAFGAGWALYRSRGGRDGKLRTWSPPEDAWTAAWSQQRPGGPRAASYWEGMAAAYAWELETLLARWFLKGCAPGGWLASELAVRSAGVPPEYAELFYRAAGRAAGRALHDPSVIHSPRHGTPPAPEDLAGDLSGASRDAFLTGVREGLALY